MNERGSFFEPARQTLRFIRQSDLGCFQLAKKLVYPLRIAATFAGGRLVTRDVIPLEIGLLCRQPVIRLFPIDHVDAAGSLDPRIVVFYCGGCTLHPSAFTHSARADP